MHGFATLLYCVSDVKKNLRMSIYMAVYGQVKMRMNFREKLISRFDEDYPICM